MELPPKISFFCLDGESPTFKVMYGTNAELIYTKN